MFPNRAFMAATPALTEWCVDHLGAIRTSPRGAATGSLLVRVDQRERLSVTGIVEDPQFRPGLHDRQFASRSHQEVIARDAFNVVCLKQGSQLGNLDGIVRSVDFFHRHAGSAVLEGEGYRAVVAKSPTVIVERPIK